VLRFGLKILWHFTFQMDLHFLKSDLLDEDSTIVFYGAPDKKISVFWCPCDFTVLESTSSASNSVGYRQVNISIYLSLLCNFGFQGWSLETWSRSRDASRDQFLKSRSRWSQVSSQSQRISVSSSSYRDFA